VEPEKTAIARQQLHKHIISTAKGTHTTIEELLKGGSFAVFAKAIKRGPPCAWGMQVPRVGPPDWGASNVRL
jgi:hypothetical protein